MLLLLVTAGEVCPFLRWVCEGLGEVELVTMGETRTVGFMDSLEVISELLEGDAGWMGVGCTGWDTGLFRTRCEMLVTVPEEEDTPKPDDFCGAEDEDEVGPAELEAEEEGPDAEEEGPDAEDEGPGAEEEGLEAEEEGPEAKEGPVEEEGPLDEEGPAELESQLALPDCDGISLRY